LIVEHIKAFFHNHPIESVLLGGVAIIALYLAFKPASASSANNGEAQLQQDYFQAEGIQAQSNAAIQVAGITTSATTAQTQIAANASTANATTYANEDEAINTSNNNTAVAALPYAEESNLIGALSGVASQTSTTTSQGSSGGFLGIGASNSTSTTTAPTQAANSAGEYLDELLNGSFSANG
jgi:hypothetical protein